MGVIADLTKPEEVFNDGNDSIVNRRITGSITGGRTLDMTGFSVNRVRAGHIIIYEASTDTYKPLGVSNGAFDSLPSGHEYIGTLIGSVSADEPFAGILYDGEVNDLAMPYPLTDTLRVALKTALPSLHFKHD